MIKSLDYTNLKKVEKVVQIPGSKSESNRALILQKLFPSIHIDNLSDSDDTLYLMKALETKNDLIDIGHAGTAMRFLTAFFAVQDGQEVVLTGSDRMQDRPISILVDALNQLGADIKYSKIEGFPPLKIKGKALNQSKITLKANVSSQYISALLLIAPALKNGLELTLDGKITSVPYIKMTLVLLNQIGCETSFVGNQIKVSKLNSAKPILLKIEPDWSSASYFYSLVALHPKAEILLKGFTKNSLQGDAQVAEIYNSLGVKTIFESDGIRLKSKPIERTSRLSLNLENTPDLAQTIACTYLGLGIDCHLTGLHTLKIKETDRLTALQNELTKFGAKVSITDDHLELFAIKNLQRDVLIETYNDHRMAMAFAPLSLKTPIQIGNPEVVSKSYKNFWADWEGLSI